MPDLLITDEMVETAAYAQWRYEWPLREFRREPDDLQDFYRNSARAALEAIAPLIAAKALLDAAAMAARNESQRSADWLRARADRIARGNAIGYATEHAATHACPSARASGEPCSPYCTDCGGRGWVA